MGHAADGDQDLGALDLAAVAELGDHTGAAGFDPLRLDAGVDVDAEALPQRSGDFLAGEWFLT